MIQFKQANNTYACILCIMLSLGLSFFGKNTKIYSNTHAALTILLTPVFSTVATIEHYSWRVMDFVREQQQLLAEIDSLQKERIALKLRLSEQERLTKDVAQLLPLEQLKQTNFPQLQTAQIISILQHANRTRMYINKGEDADIQVGDVVFDRSGIVGQIESTTPFSASVLLITDALHHTPVSVARTGDRMVISGTGKSNELKADVDIYSHQIQVGDLLLTSGLGGRFFRHYPVGTVKAIIPLSNDTRRILITPNAQLTSNEFVAVKKAANSLVPLLDE